MIECAAEERKGRQKEEKRGEGRAVLCLKTGRERGRGADKQERRFRGGGEVRGGRLAGWRRGWDVWREGLELS